MAALKTPNGKGKYRDFEAKEYVTTYILNPYKMPHKYCGFSRFAETPPQLLLAMALSAFSSGVDISKSTMEIRPLSGEFCIDASHEYAG